MKKTNKIIGLSFSVLFALGLSAFLISTINFKIFTEDNSSDTTFEYVNNKFTYQLGPSSDGLGGDDDIANLKFITTENTYFEFIEIKKFGSRNFVYFDRVEYYGVAFVYKVIEDNAFPPLHFNSDKRIYSGNGYKLPAGICINIKDGLLSKYEFVAYSESEIIPYNYDLYRP